MKNLNTKVARSILALTLGYAFSGCVAIQMMNKRTGVESTLTAPAIQFLSSSYLYSVQTALSTPEEPFSTGGIVATCSISPSLPSGLTLSATTCSISGTPTAVSAATTYTVTAVNAKGSSSATFTLEVQDIVPSISYSAGSFTFPILSVGTTGAPTNTGGAITGCAISPALPAGLSIAPTTCVISGTPASAGGPTTFSVTPSNSIGSGPAFSVTLTYANIAPSISFSSSSYSFTLYSAGSTTGAATNSGGLITSCSVTPTLPAGLSIHSTTCAISGTPSAPASDAAYTVTATNATGSDTDTINIEVANIAPALAYSQGAYNFSLNAASTTGTPTNSGGAITGCTVSPALPSGLSLNSANCTVSGTPTSVAAATNYTITVSNAVGSQNKTLSIEVLNIAPSITYSASSYSINLNASGTTGSPSNAGGAITSCSVSPALSAGLSISSTTCAISGTPTALTSPTTMTYTVTPSNAIGSGAAKSVDITVNNIAPSLTYSASSYNYTLYSAGTSGTPSNAGGAITSCAISPSLPSGLSISSTTCVISGTPTQVLAATSYTVTPSNAVGSGSSIALTLTVADVVPAITFASASYSFDLYNASSTTDVPSNSGGGITSCASSPALPAGLTLTGTNCKVSGTPSAVTAAANYTITPTNAVGSGSGVTISIAVANVVPSITFASSGTYTFTMNSAASGATATNAGGAITACSTNPALPAGLSLNSTTCAITGTPTTPQSATNYLITPSNAVGSGSAKTVTITINTIVPNIAYPSSGTYTFTQFAVVGQLPTNTGGAITGCTSSPALPTGLSLVATTCLITGAGVTPQSATNYTITPSNAAGSGTSRTVSITILPEPAPALTYTDGSYAIVQKTDISIMPVNSGGSFDDCVSEPKLPTGLALDSTTCEITGNTMDDVADYVDYEITATNNSTGATGTTTVSLSITNK
jgi:hypothetical protein